MGSNFENPHKYTLSFEDKQTDQQDITFTIQKPNGDKSCFNLENESKELFVLIQKHKSDTRYDDVVVLTHETKPITFRNLKEGVTIDTIGKYEIATITDGD